MKKIGFLVPLVTAVVLVGAACEKKDDNLNSANTNTTNTNTTANVNAANTNTANTNAAAEDKTKLAVTLPVQGAQLTSPFKIEGTAAQGSVVFINLRDKAGKTLVSTSAKVVNGTWTINAMTYAFSGTTEGDLEVYQHSTITGGKLFVTTVPVTFE